MSYDVAFRMKVVNFADNNPQLSINQVAKIFDLSYRTVRSWHERWVLEGHVQPKPVGGNNPSPLLDVHDDHILRWIKEQPDLYLREIQYRLENSHELHAHDRLRVCLSTIRARMLKLGLSHKKKRPFTPTKCALKTSRNPKNSN